MRSLRMYFIVFSMFLWLGGYGLLPLLMILFFQVAGLNWLSVFVMSLVVGFYYMIFAFHVARANAISLSLGEEPVLSRSPGIAFIRSYFRYKNLYSGELKSTPQRKAAPTNSNSKSVKKEAEKVEKQQIRNTESEYAKYPGGDLHQEISLLIHGLSDCPVRRKSERVIASLEKVYKNLEMDENDIRKSMYVIPSLLDSMLSILKQYTSVDGLTQNSQSREKIETQVMEILEKLKRALELHLQNLLENDRIALDAEIGLLKSLIRSEGLDIQQFSPDREASEVSEIILIHSDNRELTLKSGDLIGRSEGPHATFFSGLKYISGRHASLTCKNHIWYIRDLESTNKTKVNGKTIESNKDYIVQDGDRITLADQEFTLVEN